MKQINLYWIGGGEPSVPDGKTVTPINDVIIWQQCAGIANPTYTTLAEVLNDTSILFTLLNDNNAIDYLVRSKQFIKSEALVPTMTSATTPSGEVSASRYRSGDDPYHVFDNVNNTYWVVDSRINNDWIQYKFANAKCVKKAYIKSLYADNYCVKDFQIKASNDNSNWDTLYTGVVPTTKEITVTFNNSNEYLYYRVLFTSQYLASASYFGIANIQFYGEEGVTENQNAMIAIGENNYCANTLLADSTWCNAICNSTYFESVLNVKVPTMTSNTTPSGECFGDSIVIVSDNIDYYKAFNGDVLHGYWESETTAYPHYLGYMFANETCIKAFSVNAYWSNNSSIKDYQIEASNDGVTYTVIHSGTLEDVTSINTILRKNFVNSQSYKYWRLKALNKYYISTYDYCQINLLQFYGRADI